MLALQLAPVGSTRGKCQAAEIVTSALRCAIADQPLGEEVG